MYENINKELNYNQAQELLRRTNGILLDVRSYQEYCEEHLQNAINIDVYDLEKNVQNIIPNKLITIVAYCSCGTRSKQAQQILTQLGYVNAYNLKDGIYCRFRGIKNK